MRNVDIEDGELTLRWSDGSLTDDDPMVSDVLAITGARWSKMSKAWVCPITSLAEVLRFAMVHDLTLSHELVKFRLPNSRRSIVWQDGVNLFAYFPFDQRLQRAVLRVPGTVFDGKAKAWRCPVTSVVELVTFGDHYGIGVPEDLRALARYWTSRGSARPSDYVRD